MLKIGDKVKVTERGYNHLQELGASEYADENWVIRKYGGVEVSLRTVNTKQGWTISYHDFKKWFMPMSWKALIMEE